MKNHLTTLLTLALVLTGTSAFADKGGHEDMKDNKWPCAADVKKFCAESLEKGLQGHGEVMKCLDDDQDKLSKSCRTSREKVNADVKSLDDACKDDMGSFCKDVKTNDHRAMHQCMMKNESKLSDKCKAERAKLIKKWGASHGKQ